MVDLWLRIDFSPCSQGGNARRSDLRPGGQPGRRSGPVQSRRPGRRPPVQALRHPPYEEARSKDGRGRNPPQRKPYPLLVATGHVHQRREGAAVRPAAVVVPRGSTAMPRVPIAVFLLGLLLGSAAAHSEQALVLDGKIALPGGAGRIDHMAVDLRRNRLPAAEVGSGGLGVVNIEGGRRQKQTAELREPQGVAYAQKTDLIVVASAGDGTVRFLRGDDLAPAGSLALGNDADNIRIDPRTGDLIVGYGSGGLAIIDPGAKSKSADIKLEAHPESCQLAAASGRIFVNVPDAGHIAVVDLATAKQSASWTVSGLRANFPMAIDDSGAVIAVVFRQPAKLVLLDTKTGAPAQQLDTCGDADDVFFDRKRQRIYVSCGAGAVNVFQADAVGYRPLARVDTSSGARTALFVPEIDRLFVAARAGLLGSDAAILVFRPLP